jgi:hypothetical protein
MAVIEGQATFRLIYDGPALASGRMDVRDLAPALLAMGELVQEVNRTAWPGAMPVALEITATKEGSFEVVLNISEIGGLVQQVIDLFATTTAQGGQTIVEATFAIIWLLKRLRGRRIQKTELPEPGVTRLTFDDHSVINVQTVVVNLIQNEVIRRSARKAVQPLHKPGILELRLEAPRVETVRVLASEVDAFEVPELPDAPLLDEQTEMNLTITSVSFAEGNKWRLSDGETTFFATIADDAFLQRVQNGDAAFRKGDILRCRLHIQQWQTEEGLKTTYTVVEVLQHIPATRPLPLPFTDDGPSSHQR